MTAGITGAGITTAPTRPPAQLTSFVGRAEDLRRIGELLAEGRLVTPIGPGGADKTRLAIEAGARERGEVCFVELAPIGADDGAGPPGAVLQAVADALGLRETGLLTPAPGAHPHVGARLVAALTDRPMLLILDNCEHVVEDSRPADALAARRLPRPADPRDQPGRARHHRRIPVSRTPALADAGRHGGAGSTRLSAVRLFADRAAAVRPGLQVDAPPSRASCGSAPRWTGCRWPSSWRRRDCAH